jgi:hypothetical protein
MGVAFILEFKEWMLFCFAFLLGRIARNQALEYSDP